jgi:transposase
MIPKAPGQRVKTNRLDSRQIAEALRGGQLKSIHVPSMPYRQLRHLVQLRDTYVQQTTGFKSRIKALLLYEGIPFPEVPGSPWTRRVLACLDVLPCAPAVRFKLDRLLSSLRFAQEQLRQTVKEIQRFCQNDPEIRRSLAYVTSVPGLGTIVASHLLARVGDWRLLHNVRQLAGFLGLGASEYSTGEHVFRSRITRVGDARLRGKLIQGAWIAIRKDPEMKAFYERIYQRHPQHIAPKKAIVAVARKLTTRIYAVLKEQRLYRKPPVHSHPEETVCPRERLVPSAEPGRMS